MSGTNDSRCPNVGQLAELTGWLEPEAEIARKERAARNRMVLIQACHAHCMKQADPLSQPGSASLRPDSPCIGQCSTAYGDEICSGCGRTFAEVTNWIIYSEEEKAAVWARLGKT